MRSTVLHLVRSIQYTSKHISCRKSQNESLWEKVSPYVCVYVCVCVCVCESGRASTDTWGQKEWKGVIVMLGIRRWRDGMKSFEVGCGIPMNMCECAHDVLGIIVVVVVVVTCVRVCVVLVDSIVCVCACAVPIVSHNDDVRDNTVSYTSVSVLDFDSCTLRDGSDIHTYIHVQPHTHTHTHTHTLQ